MLVCNLPAVGRKLTDRGDKPLVLVTASLPTVEALQLTQGTRSYAKKKIIEYENE